MRNWKITISYDGYNFHGWQIQPDIRTVQGELNKVLQKIYGFEPKTIGASRTDAGVHAIGQVASVFLSDKFEAEDLAYRLNEMLPDDIAVKKIEPVGDDFSARYSAKKKFYEYRIISEKTPQIMNSTLWIEKKQDIVLLNSIASGFIGEHVFTAFTQIKELPEDPKCEVFRSEWRSDENGIIYCIEGNRFLYTMVRSIVGAQLDCARGRFSVEQLRQMLDEGKRLNDYKVAPAKGLCLIEVFY
jgi:tRNA pseudouridine38-40 synthase